MNIFKIYTIIFAIINTNFSNAFLLKKYQTQMIYFPFMDHQKDKFDMIQQKAGKEIVLQISSMLPNFDTIGHDILRANHDFINNVLNNDVLPHDMKKDIILGSIKLAQHGDDMGSFILQQYYNIVDACL